MKRVMTKYGLITLITVVTVSLLVQGCVSAGSYKSLRDKYDRDTIGLKTHAEQLGKVNQELNKDNQVLMMKLKMSEADNERLKQEAKANEEALNKLDENILRRLRGIEEPNVTVTQEGVEIQEEALFASGSAELKNKGKEVLKKLADILKTEPDYYVRIDGHTDTDPISSSKHKWSTGSNFELAAYRALNVLLFLEECGVNPNHMYLCSFGEHYPKVLNDSSENKAKNRRVFIAVHKMSPSDQSNKEDKKSEEGTEDKGTEEGSGEPTK